MSVKQRGRIVFLAIGVLLVCILAGIWLATRPNGGQGVNEERPVAKQSQPPVVQSPEPPIAQTPTKKTEEPGAPPTAPDAKEAEEGDFPDWDACLRAYFSMDQQPKGKGVQGVLAAVADVAAVGTKETTAFADRLLGVLKKHGVAVPAEVEQTIERNRASSRPLNDRRRLLCNQAVSRIGILSRREGRDSTYGGFDLALAKDLQSCIAHNCPSGMGRAAAAPLPMELALHPTYKEGYSPAEAIALAEAIWSYAMATPNGRWSMDRAATLYGSDMFGQTWQDLKLMLLDNATEADAIGHLDKLKRDVEAIARARIPPGAEKVLSLYLEKLDPALRERAHGAVRCYANGKEIRDAVRLFFDAVNRDDRKQVHAMTQGARFYGLDGTQSLRETFYQDKTGRGEVMHVNLSAGPESRPGEYPRMAGVLLRVSAGNGAAREHGIGLTFTATPTGIRFIEREPSVQDTPGPPRRGS